jgi:hypothetical protein
MVELHLVDVATTAPLRIWVLSRCVPRSPARWLRITNDWGNRSDGDTWRTLNVGKSSDDVGVKDADGFWIPSGCRGTVAFVQDVGSGWHKVRDGQHIHLTDIVC